MCCPHHCARPVPPTARCRHFPPWSLPAIRRPDHYRRQIPLRPFCCQVAQSLTAHPASCPPLTCAAFPPTARLLPLRLSCRSCPKQTHPPRQVCCRRTTAATRPRCPGRDCTIPSCKVSQRPCAPSLCTYTNTTTAAAAATTPLPPLRCKAPPNRDRRAVSRFRCFCPSVPPSPHARGAAPLASAVGSPCRSHRWLPRCAPQLMHPTSIRPNTSLLWTVR